MAVIAMVSMLALMEFVYFGIKVGAARGQYGIAVPAVTGDEHFERIYRVHYNTLEQLIVFLPALWTFAFYVHIWIAAGLGVIFLIGRMLYAMSYPKDPASRGLGMKLSIFPTLILLLGGFFGAAWRYFSS